MVQKVKFEMNDKQEFLNVLNAVMEHTAKKCEGCIVYFNQKGIVFVGHHSDKIAAMIVSISRENLKGYKRDYDKDKATRSLYHNFEINKNDHEKIKKFLTAGKENELSVTITENNWTLKTGSLKRTIKTYEGTIETRTSADNLLKLFKRLTGSVLVLGSMDMAEFNRYVRVTEVATRKIPSWERKKAIFQIKDKVHTLYALLDTDDMDINITKDLLLPKKPQKELNAVINIEELGQASKYFSKLADTAYIRIQDGTPIIISNTLTSTDEDMYEREINFWYMLSPVNEGD